MFTYAANSSQDDENTGMSTGGFVNNSTGEADELQAIMDDYNEMYGTQFTTENFRAYYDDINLRMKKKRADMKPLDLCLVVGMFLTGFDSKKLNTLYVDKNMEYHGLMQAFSRTNRVLNEKKRFGKIVCFRDLKSNVDASVKLFSSEDNETSIIRPPFCEVKKSYQELTQAFLKQYPTTDAIELLKSETEKRDIVVAFRDVIRKHEELKIYNEFEENAPDLGMTEQQYMDFRSKYLDIYDILRHEDPPTTSPNSEDPQSNGGDNGNDDDTHLTDIDFCLELLHSDIINVNYIIALLKELNSGSNDFSEKCQNILKTMRNDAEMRNKTPLVDDFIQEHKELFTAQNDKIDIEKHLNNYIIKRRNKAIEVLSEEENVDTSILNHYISEYEYLQRKQPEIIQEALKHKHLGLLKKRKTLTRILNQLHSIIRTYSWN